MTSGLQVAPAAAPRGSGWRMLLWALLIFGLVVALALGALVAGIVGMADQMHININGVPVRLADLHGGHVLLAIGGVLLAALIVTIVVPMALLLGLMGSAIGLGLGLFGVLLAAAIVLSPLIAAGALAWFLLRRKPTPPTTRMDP